MKRSIQNKVLASILAGGKGCVSTPSDLLGVGSRAAVDQALSRLVRAGSIRRLGRGLYDLPRVHPTLGPLSPSPDDVAKALARSGCSRLQVSGARAANLLGLSTQVPTKLVYATDGGSRRVRLGRQTIELRKAAPRRLAGAGTPAGTALQALRHLGPDGATDDVVAKLSGTLSAGDKAALKRLLPAAPAWLRPTIDRIAASG
jgi:uncharacterized protein DUF6088